MPKDKRLWMTFPIDFWQHPKIAVLSDNAFRTFVELNGYSRMQDLDGSVPAVFARKTWKAKALSELLANHPERPSLILDGDVFVIWNYSEHQQTTADRARAAEVSRSNGHKGGRPKNNPDVTQPGSENNPDRTQRKAESESESELEIELQDTHTSGPVLQTPESYPQGPDDVESVEELCVRQSARMGVDYGKVRAAITKACGRFPAPHGVMVIIATVLERAKPPIKSPTGVVLAAVRNDWAEFQQYLDVVAS